MGAPYMWLNCALEDALYSYLSGQIDPAAGARLYVMAEALAADAPLTEPYIGVTCPDGRPFDTEAYLTASTSQRIVQARLTIRTHAAPGARARHALLVGMVMDALHRTDLVAVLNAQQVPNLQVDQVDHVTDATAPADRSYETALTFDVVCHVVEGGGT
jgi:hypothetical protein